VDEQSEQQHFIRETMIRLQAHELKIAALESDKKNLTQYTIELQGKLKENTTKAHNDFKMLSNGLNELKSQKERIDEISNKRAQRADNIKPALMPTRLRRSEVSIQDYFVRLNTTSIHQVKYSETVEIILNLLENDKSKIKHNESYYKTLIKAFGSKNSSVLESVHKIIMEVGGINQKITMYMQSGV